MKRFWPAYFVASLLFSYTRFDLSVGTYSVFSCVTLILGVIGLAYRFPQINVKIDISYGIYIYHMIVVNALLAMGFSGKVVHLLIVLAVSILLALISHIAFGHLWKRKSGKKV